MRLIRYIKKNNGSTLTLVLFMLFLLAVTAIAAVTITGSELRMSAMTSDRSKALLVAQAGSEQAAQVLDEAVAQAQEDARVKSSEVIQNKINDFKKVNVVDGVDVPITITSPFNGVIDNSDISEIKILKEDALNKIYYDEYKYWFNKKINDWLSTQTNTGDWKDGVRHDISGDPNGKFTYESVGPINSTDELKSEDVSNISQYATTSITLTSTGEYKSTNGSNYKRKLQVEFGLLTDTKGGTSEIPVSYGKLTKVRVNKKSSILTGKALIAQKNIISIDGTVNVTGDVISFGSIPIVTASPTEIDYDAEGYKFGGIMAGMTSSNNSDISKVWEDVNIGNGTSSLNDSLSPSAVGLNLPNDFFTINHSGSFNIVGNAGTLAYLHSLYSEFADSSTITVKEDTFARSVKVESESNFSLGQFKNVYTTDDLRIDGFNSEVKIGGWNGSTPPDPAGSEGLLVGLSTGTTSKSSSAVIVAGDSKLYINGSVYIGGSTFYTEYNNAANKGYISGISVQKSDSSPVEAFEMYNDIVTPTSLTFPGNVFYFYDKSGAGSYIKVNDPSVQQKLMSSGYEYAPADGTTPSSILMMTGKGLPDPTDLVNQSKYTQIKAFDIIDRAMHFKYIWDDFWKVDVGYSSYLNTEDIIIEPVVGGKIKGFCYGAVAANYEVYGPYKGFAGTDVLYVHEKEDGNTKYAKLMDLFIKDQNGLINAATPTKKLAGNEVTSEDSVNKAALVKKKLYSASSNAFMYYGDENIVLTDNYVGSSINALSKASDDGYIRGIVYSSGDIYVKDGTKFKGILIAEGNIVFLGDADIVYDEDVVDILTSEKPEISKFFKQTDVLMNTDNAIVQTIKKTNVKNIKIIKWKEI
ncbi:MAG TPA: pilus assembly PilX N-terminal domain-containing protein [Ruminiclostridium sp.]